MHYQNMPLDLKSCSSTLSRSIHSRRKSKTGEKSRALATLQSQRTCITAKEIKFQNLNSSVEAQNNKSQRASQKILAKPQELPSFQNGNAYSSFISGRPSLSRPWTNFSQQQSKSNKSKLSSSKSQGLQNKFNEHPPNPKNLHKSSIDKCFPDNLKRLAYGDFSKAFVKPIAYRFGSQGKNKSQENRAAKVSFQILKLHHLLINDPKQSHEYIGKFLKNFFSIQEIKNFDEDCLRRFIKATIEFKGLTSNQNVKQFVIDCMKKEPASQQREGAQQSPQIRVLNMKQIGSSPFNLKHKELQRSPFQKRTTLQDQSQKSLIYSPSKGGPEEFVRNFDIPKLTPTDICQKVRCRKESPQQKIYDYINSQEIRLAFEIVPSSCKNYPKKECQLQLVGELEGYNPKMKEIKSKRTKDGIMKRNKLLLEHILHERLEKSISTQHFYNFFDKPISQMIDPSSRNIQTTNRINTTLQPSHSPL